MISMAITQYLADGVAQSGELGTKGVNKWLIENVIPLVLLAAGLLMLWLGGGKGDNSGVMKRLAPIAIALAVIGIAVSGAGVNMGQWIAGLFTG